MSSKKDVAAAIKLYEKFYQFEPRHVVESKLAIPKSAQRVGVMKAVMYASDKWEKKINYYKHDHDTGVHLYVPGSGGAGKGKAVPRSITSCNALTKLGRCVGVIYVEDGEEKTSQMPGCNLYAIPSGRALVIVKGTHVEALIWGGRLTVEGRGIVY